MPADLIRTFPFAPPARPFDVAVVIPTVLRPHLARAVRSIFAQHFPGTIQILLGVDTRLGDSAVLGELVSAAPSNCVVSVFDPGYSTSARHGGFSPAGDGGAIRTILSYAAHSRLVAYLDDDNWWAPDHLATLVRAIAGRAWAFSLRWFADPTGQPLCIDRWESVGPDAGVFRERFGGFVDPSCLLLDKTACEPALRLWNFPIPGDASGMSADRAVFRFLRGQPVAGTGRATAFYTLNPADVNHTARMERIAAAGPERPTFSVDWFTRHIPLWSRLLAPLAGQPVEALEIGVFEGRSTVWLLENVLTHPDARLTWVDTFAGSPEHARMDLGGLESRFRGNVARFAGKASGHVGRSADVLPGLPRDRFDFIHVDGSHEAPDVLADAVLAWPLLKVGGVMAFDDYAWREFPEPERLPGPAIDAFLAVMKGRFEEVHRGYQLWVRKTR